MQEPKIEDDYPQHSGFEGGEPLFSAKLTPHRSLGANGFWALIIFVGFSCFTSGILFMSMGAWPIAIFMLVDFLAIWLAFKWNYRAAREYEVVDIWRDRLRVMKVCPAGKRREEFFNTYGTRFSVDRHEEYGITKMKLTDKGHELNIGSFLNPCDRESFATAFGQALARAKHF